jgi:hypothetical protein
MGEYIRWLQQPLYSKPDKGTWTFLISAGDVIHSRTSSNTTHWHRVTTTYKPGDNNYSIGKNIFTSPTQKLRHQLHQLPNILT